jgi:hypothetical protein
VRENIALNRLRRAYERSPLLSTPPLPVQTQNPVQD